TGSALTSKPVKKRVAVKATPPKNEAASLIVKPTRNKAAKAPRKLALFANEAASSAIRPTAKKTKVKTKVSTKTASKGKKSSSKKVTRVSKKRGGKFSTRRNRYRKIIAKHARANGVPIRLAMAVVQVESSYRASARGAAGEIGLMQLMPRTARFIGYKGPLRSLYHPDTNIRYGMKYLGKAYRLGGGSVCGAILKYNAGHGAKRMNPISRKYCKRVRGIMRRG
ncbi:MAG: transglycosylase SLT domain-containing protein, partial [Rhizobiaceae bacterium]